jgi:hypothetical protein
MLRRILIILGALVALLPYLGLPRSWDNVLFTFAGLTIILLLVLGKRSSSSREAGRTEVTPLRESIETKHTPRPVNTVTISPAAPPYEKSRRTEPMHKMPEVHPKTEVRRIARVSPARPASSSPAPRSQIANHRAPNDVVVPPQVRPTPPPLPTTHTSPVSGHQSFEERKPTPIRRSRPKSAEDFLKGDSA